jgi:hypothetical protein
MVHGHDTLEEARPAWWRGGAARQAAPDEPIMLAHRRVDVQALNEAARAIRLDAGELEAGVEVTVATAQGERSFAIEERVYFLRNDRAWGEERDAGDGAHMGWMRRRFCCRCSSTGRPGLAPARSFRCGRGSMTRWTRRGDDPQIPG